MPSSAGQNGEVAKVTDDHDDQQNDDEVVYELSRLTVIRYIDMSGALFHEVYWEDNRGDDDLTYEEKMGLIVLADRDARMSDYEFEVVFRAADDDDDFDDEDE